MTLQLLLLALLALQSTVCSFIVSSPLTHLHHLGRPLHIAESEDLFTEDASDFDDIPCMPPRASSSNERQTKIIMIISDRTGNTVKSALNSGLTQFDASLPDYKNDCDIQLRTFTFVRSEDAVASIVKKATEKNAFVIFTLADPNLRLSTKRMCELAEIESVDLMGPIITGLECYLQKEQMGKPTDLKRRKVTLSDTYFRRVEAVEFTLKADDGQSPWLLPQADIVIVGVSRTGKTPLSVVLSQTMGLKVANVPLVMECPLPKELFQEELDPSRVFCLTLAPSELKKIRTTRLERRNVKEVEKKYDFEEGDHRSTYADRAYILNDLKHARDLATKQNWTEIDVTGRAVEETASLISELMHERFDEELYNVGT